MTWYFDPSTGDVHDHEGTLVANLVDDYGWNRSWSGEFPVEMFAAMRDNFQNGSFSQYNQQLLRDAATENIQEGTP